MLEDIKDGNQVVEKLGERLEGRFPLNDIVHPETGEIIVDTKTMIIKEIRATLFFIRRLTPSLKKVEEGLICTMYSFSLSVAGIKESTSM